MQKDYLQLIKLSQLDKHINHLHTLKVMSDNELNLDNYFRKISHMSTHRDNLRNRRLQQNNVISIFKYAEKNYKRSNTMKKFVLTSNTFSSLPKDCLLEICKYII